MKKNKTPNYHYLIQMEKKMTIYPIKYFMQNLKKSNKIKVIILNSPSSELELIEMMIELLNQMIKIQIILYHI